MLVLNLPLHWQTELSLDLAFKILGIGPSDEVVVTSRTFLASVSAIVNCGATPVFADVERGIVRIFPRPRFPHSFVR